MSPEGAAVFLPASFFSAGALPAVDWRRGSGEDASNTVQRAETHLAARGGGLGRGLGSHFEVGDVVWNAGDEVDVLDVMDAVGW